MHYSYTNTDLNDNSVNLSVNYFVLTEEVNLNIGNLKSKTIALVFSIYID